MNYVVSEKAYKGFGMEGVTAKWYASLTLKSLDEFKALARRASDQVPSGSQVLEIAPGPGYFAIELAKLGGYRIFGLDISHRFVKIARENAVKAGVDVDFRQGNAAGMPFDSKTFDFLFAARHSRISASQCEPWKKCIAFSSQVAALSSSI